MLTERDAGRSGDFVLFWAYLQAFCRRSESVIRVMSERLPFCLMEMAIGLGKERSRSGGAQCLDGRETRHDSEPSTDPMMDLFRVRWGPDRYKYRTGFDSVHLHPPPPHSPCLRNLNPSHERVIQAQRKN